MLFEIVAAFFLFLALKTSYDVIYMKSSNKSVTRMQRIAKLYQTESVWDKINYYLESVAKKFTTTMDKEAKKELIEKLRRAGIDITYEKYITQKIIYPILIFLSFFVVSYLFTYVLNIHPMIPFVGYFLRIFAVIALIITFFDMDKKVERSLQELRNGIIIEMPGFLSTYRYSPPGKQFMDIAKDFSKNATYMKYDLSLLIVDIDQYGTEKAIKMFAQRIDILEVSEAAAIFINDLAGSKEDSKINVEILENKFLEIYKYKLKDTLKERPTYLEMLNTLAIVAITFLFVVVLGYQVAESFIKLR